MNLLNLFAKITLDKKNYEKGLQESEKQAKSSSSNIGVALGKIGKGFLVVATVVTTVTGAMYKLSQSVINQGDVIDKDAQKLGMSYDAYQKWAIALEMAGTSIDTLNIGMRSLTDFTQKLSEGNGEALLTLQELGIGYEDFMAMSVDEQLKTIVESLQDMESQTDKVRLAQEIFGNRTYQELLPLLNQEKGSLDELFKEFEDLGLIMDDTAVQKSAVLNDKMTLLTKSFQAFSRQIVEKAYPSIELLVDGLAGLISGSEEASTQISDGVSGLVNIVLDGVDNLLDNLPTILDKLVDVINDILVKLSDILLTLDWEKLFVGIIDGIEKLLVDGLPIIIETINKLLQMLLDLVTTEDGLKKLGEIGGRIVQAIGNGLVVALNSLGKLLVDTVNSLADGLSLMWTWAGIPEIPDIPYIPDIPMIKWFADGGMFDMLQKGTAYAIAGESGAEIVAQGRQGTGVANIDQIAEAQLSAMEQYNDKETMIMCAENIVNAILQGRMGGNGNEIRLNISIGDRQFKDYVFQIVNEQLKSKGFKPITDISRY